MRNYIKNIYLKINYLLDFGVYQCYYIFMKINSKRENITKLSTTRFFCYNGIIASVYLTLVFIFQFMSFGQVQFRIAECLTILPALFPFSTFGLTVGCFISNFLSTWGWVDVIVGTLCTLVAGIMSSLIKNPYLSAIPPILINAFVLPLTWYLFAGEAAYWINVLWVFIGQAVVLYALGIPLYFIAKKQLLPIVYPTNKN